MAPSQREGLFPWIRRKLEKKARRLAGRGRRLLGLSHTAPLGEPDVFELLRDRSVALVGNAQSLTGTDRGAVIDAHDLVIRCNAAPIPDVRSHGAKTDIIATSIGFDAGVMDARRARYLFWMSPQRDDLPGWMLRWPGFFLFPEESHRVLLAAIGRRPTTGLMVIALLSRSPCRKVSLHGFDFFRSQSLSGALRKAATPHDPAAEERFVSDLVRTDPRFSLN